MNNWHGCIVSFIDMIGISEKLRKNSSESVMIMRRMHEDIYIIYLQASSLAFSNCFEIEKEAKKRNWGFDWYIDNRIKIKISPCDPDKTKIISLFPRSTNRKIYMYYGNLFNTV